LPNQDVAIDDFVESLDPSAFTVLGGSKDEAEITLYLPRFQVEYQAELKDTLSAMGMADAFQAGVADFSGIAGGSLCIGQVTHKTRAKFDENGGEASAATAVGVCLESCVQYETVRVDRPFVAGLYDEDTGALLFVGVIKDPQ
jgi:serpin B